MPSEPIKMESVLGHGPVGRINAPQARGYT